MAEIPVVNATAVVPVEEQPQASTDPKKGQHAVHPTSVKATQQAAVAMIPQMGRTPTGLICPYCQKQAITRTKDRSSGITILVAVLLIFLYLRFFQIWLKIQF